MLFLPLLSLIPLASAWGSLGHRTVAYLAELDFTSDADQWVRSLLDGEDISEAALYPDKIAQLPEYKYTKPWHYIDAQDDPPTTCFLNFTRDCMGSCIVTALVNHTERVVNPNLSKTDRGLALRFIMHFFGDIHQPMHTENLGYGGNTVRVSFDGQLTNLHSVWDHLIPNKHAGMGSDMESIAAGIWSSKLYHPQSPTPCLSDIKTCSLEWAAEANTYVCSYCLKDGVSGLPKDLGEKYYEEGVPLVEQQIARAGQRLAAWINKLAPPFDSGEL